MNKKRNEKTLKKNIIKKYYAGKKLNNKKKIFL